MLRMMQAMHLPKPRPCMLKPVEPIIEEVEHQKWNKRQQECGDRSRAQDRQIHSKLRTTEIMRHRTRQPCPQEKRDRIQKEKSQICANVRCKLSASGISACRYQSL